MTTKWWGAGFAGIGLACLGYDWIYIPVCEHIFHATPWTITVYGLVNVGLGIALNLFQWSFGEHPPRKVTTHG